VEVSSCSARASLREPDALSLWMTRI